MGPNDIQALGIQSFMIFPWEGSRVTKKYDIGLGFHQNTWMALMQPQHIIYMFYSLWPLIANYKNIMLGLDGHVAFSLIGQEVETAQVDIQTSQVHEAIGLFPSRVDVRQWKDSQVHNRLAFSLLTFMRGSEDLKCFHMIPRQFWQIIEEFG